jgi:hypothetical protein
MLVVAAVGGAMTLEAGAAGTPVGPTLGLGAFLAAMMVRFYMLTAQPEHRWHEGRVAAETVKTLAWRYAVGGQPFPIDEDGDADELFLQRIEGLLLGVEMLENGRSAGAQITDDMRVLRASSLSERREAYLRDRIQDQRTWYATRARSNRARALASGLAVLALQIVGVGVALARIAQWIEVSLLGIVAVAGAIVAAWSQTRQYESLSTAYSVAAQELAGIESRIGRAGDERSWASFVADAEKAIAREHNTWRVSRRLRRSSRDAP